MPDPQDMSEQGERMKKLTKERLEEIREFQRLAFKASYQEAAQIARENALRVSGMLGELLDSHAAQDAELAEARGQLDDAKEANRSLTETLAQARREERERMREMIVNAAALYESPATSKIADAVRGFLLDALDARERNVSDGGATREAEPQAEGKVGK